MHDEPLNSTTTQLSAFLDGELPQGEAELFIRRLERDQALKRAFARYALIGEILRTPANSGGIVATAGFAARVSDTLAAESAPPQVPAAVTLPAAAGAGRWFRPLAGLSIAAGVVIVAIGLMGRSPDTLPVAAVAEQTGEPADATLAEASYVVPEITVTGPLLPAARLTNYVMAHSEYSSPLGRRNVLSNMLADEPAADAIVPAGFVPDQDPASVQP